MNTILPTLVNDFLDYMTTMEKSKNTVEGYAYDLEIFFKYMKIRRNMVKSDTNFNEIDISDIDVDFIRTIVWSDLYAFMSYVTKYRENKSNARARKTACLKSFFTYLELKAKVIKENPTRELDTPKLNSRLPAYLTLEESKALIKNIDGRDKERDTAIIVLFLNCGMRLSELVGINISNINGDILTVIGKGNKERTVYLNNASMKAIKNYLEVRPKEGVIDEDALFISNRNMRMDKRTVQYLVKKFIKKSGLDGNKISTHKLRHTAATLMYKYGDVDIRALQQILGHESVATTQIYTHLDDEKLRDAVNSNPLANE